MGDDINGSESRDRDEPSNISASPSGNTQQAQKLQGQKEEQKCRLQERLHDLRRGTWQSSLF